MGEGDGCSGTLRAWSTTHAGVPAGLNDRMLAPFREAVGVARGRQIRPRYAIYFDLSIYYLSYPA